MTYWTILIIVYGGAFEGYQSAIPFISAEACGEFLSKEYPPSFLDPSIPVHRATCKSTDIPSSSPKPQKRPK